MLQVTFDEKWPFDMLTKNENGHVLYRTPLPVHCTDDKTPYDALNCVNFDDEPGSRFDRETCAAANRQAFANEVLRAAAPDLLEALEESLAEMEALMRARAIPYQGGLNIAIKARAAIAKAKNQPTE